MRSKDKSKEHVYICSRKERINNDSLYNYFNLYTDALISSIIDEMNLLPCTYIYKPNHSITDRLSNILTINLESLEPYIQNAGNAQTFFQLGKKVSGER